MNSKLRRSVSFKVSVCLLGAMICPSANAAESGSADCIAEIARAESVNQATLRVAEARLALENWKLGQLTSLRGRGHATWLEVARQQLLTDSLLHQRTAIAKLSAFNQSLLRRLRLASESVNQHSAGHSPWSFAPIKLSAPGSVRLVGWIEPSQISEEIRSQLASPSEARSGRRIGDRELAFAKERLSHAERRFDVYASRKPALPHHLREAELRRALARAEVELHQIACDQRSNEVEEHPTSVVDSRESTPDSGETSLPVGGIDNYFTSRASHHLMLATVRVAKSEACATGELQAAQITSQRFKLLLEAARELHAKGYATARELKDARAQLDSADRRVAELRRQYAELTESCHMIQGPLDGTASTVSVRPSESWIDSHAGGPAELVDDWPLSMVTNLQVVRHVLELRRSYLTSVAQRQAFLLKVAMLEEYCTKLKQSIANTHDSYFSERSRRQLADLELRIQYNQARRQGAQERLGVLCAEERRFMEQCLAQQQIVNRFADALPGPPPLHLVSLLGSREDESTSVSYLESDFFGRPENLRRCVLASTGRDDLWSTVRIEDSYLPHGETWSRVRSYRSVESGGAGGGGDQSSQLDQKHDAFSLHNAFGTRSNGLQPERDYMRTLNTRDAYPFGILRSDLRHQLSPGQPPWYLPGSPTNLKYR